MMNRRIEWLLLVAITSTLYGEVIVLPEPSQSLPPDYALTPMASTPVSEMLTALPYDIGWFRVVPMGIRESTASRPGAQVDLEMWTARRDSHVFSVRCTAKTQDYIWFGDGYRRILAMQKKPGDVNERWMVNIEPKSHTVEGLPKLSGALLPVRKEYEHAELWGGCAFVKEIRAVDGGDELEAEIALLNSLVHKIHFDRPPDRTVVMRKGDVIEVPAKVGTGRATAKVRCAGVYREMADKGFSGGVDLVPVEWTFYKDAR